MRIIISHRYKYEDKSFLAAIYIYTILAFVPFMKAMPVVSVQMPIMLLSYFFLIVSMLNNQGRKYTQTVVFYSLLVIILNYVFIYLQSNWGGASIINRIGANYSLFVSSYPVIILISGGLDRVDKKKLVFLFTLLITIICITTIIGTYKYWAPCRELATPNNPELNAKYLKEGIAGYGFIYCLVIVFPILLRELRKRKSVGCLIPVIFSLYCVIRSEYTIAIIILLFGILLSVLMYRKFFIGVVLIGIIGVLVILYAENILLWAIGFFQDTSLTITIRLREMLRFFQYESVDGDMLIRQGQYLKSIYSLLNNPLFGGFFHMGYAVGGHSEILDLLGHAGIIGGILLIYIIQWIRKHTAIGRIKRDSYIITLYIIAFVIAVFNTFSAPELFFAILIIPIIFEQEECKKDNKESEENAIAI